MRLILLRSRGLYRHPHGGTRVESPPPRVETKQLVAKAVEQVDAKQQVATLVGGVDGWQGGGGWQGRRTLCCLPHATAHTRTELSPAITRVGRYLLDVSAWPSRPCVRE